MKKLILIIFYFIYNNNHSLSFSFGYRRDSNPNTFYKVYLNGEVLGNY